MDLPFTAYRRADPQWNMERPHLHGEIELLFPLSDGDDIFIDSTVYPLRRGDLFVMDAAVPHRSRARSRREYHRCVLHLPPETLRVLGLSQLSQLLTAKGSRATLSEEEFCRCRQLFQRLTAPPQAQADSLRCTAALVEVMALVMDKWSEPQQADAPTPSDATMAAVIGYIRAHLTEPLTLEGLADRFYMSRSSLCHRFKAATGLAVMEYVILCRIQYARTLLVQGMSVQQAGEAAGFGDNAHFIRSFRRLTGQTPGRYAKSGER